MFTNNEFINITIHGICHNLPKAWTYNSSRIIANSFSKQFNWRAYINVCALVYNDLYGSYMPQTSQHALSQLHLHFMKYACVLESFLYKYIISQTSRFRNFNPNKYWQIVLHTNIYCTGRYANVWRIIARPETEDLFLWYISRISLW